MNNLTLSPVIEDGQPIASAEAMRLDEGGVDLLIDGETELSASFDGLDLFELAFRVLPEDFELEQSGTWSPDVERAWVDSLDLEVLEQHIWISLQAYAAKKGLKK